MPRQFPCALARWLCLGCPASAGGHGAVPLLAWLAQVCVLQAPAWHPLPRVLLCGGGQAVWLLRRNSSPRPGTNEGQLQVGGMCRSPHLSPLQVVLALCSVWLEGELQVGAASPLLCQQNWESRRLSGAQLPLQVTGGREPAFACAESQAGETWQVSVERLSWAC